MNIMRNPEKNHAAEEAWLGWYEGGIDDDTDGKWTLGFATAPHALGPWFVVCSSVTILILASPHHYTDRTKYAGNPIMQGNVTCDASRQFHGDPKHPKQFCNGLYVGSVLHDDVHTRGEYWLYLEAPINMNDEGPLSLWTSPHPTGNV